MALENRTVQSVTTNTLPTGTDPLVDNTASGDVQVIKLASGTIGSVALIPGDDTDGLLVNLGTNNDITGTVTANLAAGTNNIGDVDVLSIAAGDNNIGNVDVVTIPAPLSTTGGGTEATALRVTVATDSTGVLSVDDNGGNLSIDDGGNSITVDNGGTFATQDSQVIADNAGFTDGTSKVFTAGFIYDEVAGTALTENDAAAGRINVNRAQVATIEDGVTRGRYATVTAANAVKVDASGAAVPVTDNSGSLTVDNGGTFAVQAAQSGSWSLAANQSVNVAQMNGVATTMGNGISGTGVQRVTIASDSTGQVAIASGTVTTVSTLTGGGVAHDGVDSGNPVKVGAKAVTNPSTATMVASGDRVDLSASVDGALFVRNVPLGDLITEAVSDTAGTSTAFSNFGATASTRNYITAITAFRTDAGTSMAYIDIRDGTAGSVLYRIPLPPAGGVTLNNGGSPLLYSSANTALAYDVSGALTTVYISVTGFKSKARA